VLSRAALPFALAAPLLLSTSIPASQQPTFRARTIAVRVDVLVTDGRHPVAGLSAADFELRDNGVLQNIEAIDTGDAPLNVVLALDTSSSVEGKRYEDLVSATEGLLAGLTPQDRVALITFSHAVVPRIALSANIAAVRTQLGRGTPVGRTSMIDGVYVALTATLAQAGRSLVMVFTDGDDVSSWLEPAEVVDSATRSNAVIYAVTSSARRELRTLDQVTGVTGGDMLRVKSSADLRGAFEGILRAFRSRYVLAYTPTGVPAGGFHRLDVRLKRRGFKVTARPGYIGAEPAK